MKTVIKRDGAQVDFDITLIVRAVNYAMDSAGLVADRFAEQIAEQVVRRLPDHAKINIEQIQEYVENALMTSGFPEVAREYIQYRHDRDTKREQGSEVFKQINGLLDSSDLDIMNENANKDAKIIPTQRDLVAGIVAKNYARKHILPKHIVRAHDEGILHYHDLDYAPFFPMFNCMLINLEGMLKNGFKMNNAQIETPKSIGTACAITAQIIASVASHIFGGNTINRIDEVLAPYVTMTYDKHFMIAIKYGINHPDIYAEQMTEKSVYDAIQGLEYEVNTLSTTNGQTPFTTFGFGLGTSWESKLIQKAILEVRIKGLGKTSKTAVFPKLVYAIKAGHNQKAGDPFYDVKQLALKCATERMYPDILNYDMLVEKTGSFKFPMGCRSFLHTWENEDGKEIHEGRNNIGVVSLNLPRVALDAIDSAGYDNRIDAFYALLDERMLLVKDALMTRIDRLRGVKASVAPILYTEGACGIRLKPDDEIMQLFENGRASISCGYIGLHELTQILFDAADRHVYNSRIQSGFLELVLARMKSHIDEWTEETGFAFSLYGTPSENLCDRFCRLDKKKYGKLEVFAKGYYTNSFHLDVQKKVNPYDKIDFEAPFVKNSTGGFICYGEFPNMRDNLKALEQVWDYSYTKVPYYGTNTPIDECYQCGFKGEFEASSKGYECPNCGNHDSATVNVTRRVCGYLGSPDSRPFNEGKQSEVIRRVKHM